MTDKSIVAWKEIQSMGEVFFKSGMFGDMKNAMQAMVKIQAGNELGLPPFASMAGIHIVSGKPTLGSNIVATLIENDPRYHYQVNEASDTKCSIDFYKNEKKSGNVTITIQEAHKANMHQQWKNGKFEPKITWKNFPSDMLFARCMTRGARRYTPGIFGGSPIYTPEEMGVDVDEEGFVDVQFKEEPPVEPVKTVTREDVSETVTAGPGTIMGIETALAMLDSKGVKYGSLDTSTLSGKFNTMDKKLRAGEYSGDERTDKEMKRDACRMIMDERNK